jgi:uncharacterized protein YjbI with pentapeptide repeats
MANDEHVALLKKGVAAWNAWRDENPEVSPDLSEANLIQTDLRLANLSQVNLKGAQLSGPQPSPTIMALKLLLDDLRNLPEHGADLSGANLSGANLTQANLRWALMVDTNLTQADLSWASLVQADLSGAVLTGALLYGAVLSGAKLRAANLSNVDLRRASLEDADLRGADLTQTNLEKTSLVKADFTNTDLSGCRIHGVSAWDLKLEGAKQESLIITPRYEPEITVDNIEVAQFVYLLLHNEKIRNVIDTVTSESGADPRSLHS